MLLEGQGHGPVMPDGQQQATALIQVIKSSRGKAIKQTDSGFYLNYTEVQSRAGVGPEVSPLTQTWNNVNHRTLETDAAAEDLLLHPPC